MSTRPLTGTMKRPVALLLTLAEAEALVLLLARHAGLFRVICHEMGVDPKEISERWIEAHRAGVAISAQ